IAVLLVGLTGLYIIHRIGLSHSYWQTYWEDPNGESQDGQVYVLLVGYMRGGTSLLGSVFENDKETNYWFEPIAPVYNALYGLNGNVQSHYIINFPNGTSRQLPHIEMEAIVSEMKKLMTCDLENLPIEVIVRKSHNTIDKHNEKLLSNLTKCIQESGYKHKQLDVRLRFCKKYLAQTRKSSCRWEAFPNKFTEECIDPFYGSNRDLKSVQNKFLGNPSEVDLAWDLKMYGECLEDLKVGIQKCLKKQKSSEECKSQKFQVVKTVRLTLGMAREILKVIPTVKVIHILRDPRGILHSRGNFHGPEHIQFSRGDIGLSAKQLCERMADDNIQGNKLRSQYPGQFMEIKYEDFVDKPQHWMKRLYDFIGKNIPSGLVETIKDQISGNCTKSNKTHTDEYFGVCRQSGRDNIEGWQNLTKDHIEAIDKHCLEISVEKGYHKSVKY
ncbi:unnamed protein product, partial [Owenia fusiformis]